QKPPLKKSAGVDLTLSGDSILLVIITIKKEEGSNGKKFSWHKESREPEGGLCRRVAGEPSLSLLRARCRYRGLPGCRRFVPRHVRGRNRACVRASRFSQRSRRSRYRRADRHHVEKFKVGRGRRDLRIHRNVSGVCQDRARGGLLGAGRVVRNPGEGGKIPRRQVYQGPGYPGKLRDRSRNPVDGAFALRPPG